MEHLSQLPKNMYTQLHAFPCSTKPDPFPRNYANKVSSKNKANTVITLGGKLTARYAEHARNEFRYPVFSARQCTRE